jgi:hypothetical protein
MALLLAVLPSSSPPVAGGDVEPRAGPSAIAHAQPTTGELTNPSFEGGWTRETLYWTPEGGPFSTEFGEIATPAGWVSWWREGFPCPGTDKFVMGRPEVKVIDLDAGFPDPERVRTGSKAAQWFTFWRCHFGGLLQRVAAEPGRLYSVSAYVHSWYSRCSERPHAPPYDEDCATPISWAWDRVSVGIDPTGGVDPMALSVVWGQEREIYGRYGRPVGVWNVPAEAGADHITIFLRSRASHPLKHDDAYWDDVVLFEGEQEEPTGLTMDWMPCAGSYVRVTAVSDDPLVSVKLFVVAPNGATVRRTGVKLEGREPWLYRYTVGPFLAPGMHHWRVEAYGKGIVAEGDLGVAVCEGLKFPRAWLPFVVRTYPIPTPYPTATPPPSQTPTTAPPTPPAQPARGGAVGGQPEVHPWR